LRGATAALLAVVVVFAGVAGLAAFRPADRPPEERPLPAPPPAARAEDKPLPRVDRFDDPLPDEAIARIGTTRFRHGDNIFSVAFAADGKRLLSFGVGGIRVWDAATGREQRHLAAEPDTRLIWAAFSPDGKLAATTQTEAGGTPKDYPIILWDLTTGKKVKELGKGTYVTVCLSPDGKLLAAARYDNAVETWDVAAGKRLASWQAHEGRNRAPFLAFTEDGKTLMTAGIDQAVCFWEPATGKKLRGFDGIVSQTRSLALSADGKFLAAVEHKPSPPRVIGGEAPTNRVRILDAADGKELRHVEVPATKLAYGQVNTVRCVALSRDGKTLAGADAENTVHLWDVATGKELTRLTAFAPVDMAFAPDGKRLAVATWGNAIRLYDVATGKELPRGSGLDQQALSVGLTPDGRTLATTGGMSAILLWDTATGERRRRLEGHEGLVRSLCLSDDGRTLFSAGGDGTVRAWDVAAGRQLPKFAGEQPGEWPYLLACSPGGKLLAVLVQGGRTDPVVRLIDTTTGRSAREIDPSHAVVRNIDPSHAVVHGAAFLPDGRSLVVWTGDRKARVWDVTTGKAIREVEYTGAGRARPEPVPVPGLGEWSIFAAAVSADGRRIAFGSRNELIAVYELTGGAEVCRVEKVFRSFGCLAFSPDGRTLAWGDRADQSVHLLEIATGKERRAFTGHRGGVVSLTFSADGRTLVSGGNDTTLLVWDLAGRGARGGAPSAAERDVLWGELLGDDAPRADRAVRRLAASPKSAVGLFRERLKPVVPADEKHVARLIADLDSEDFSTREKSAAELDKLGDLASEACRKALAGRPSAEVRRKLAALLEKQAGEARKPSAERVRLLRALEVLELAATEEARRLLAELAKGAPGAWLTEEAKMAAARLERIRGWCSG
jgi:WD40 repeat protein